jgi:hypothetical protein
MTMASHRPLPVAIEEITRDWLTAALRTGTPDVTVRAFEIVDVNRGTCTKIWLRLDLDEMGREAGIPELVFLKGGSKSTLASCAICTSGRFEGAETSSR